MEVDEERTTQTAHAGTPVKHPRVSILRVLFPLSIEIIIDDSIKRTFSVISFITHYYMVQKVARKEVGHRFVPQFNDLLTLT